MEIEQLLDEEIKRLLEKLPKLNHGSAERAKTINELDRLYNLKINGDKIKLEKEKDSSDQHEKTVERYFRYGAAGLELLIPIIAYGIWFSMGLKFEETGTVCSPMTKNLMPRLLPKKK